MSATASEQQFQEVERLIDEGHSLYAASRLAGTTLTALKKGDRERHARLEAKTKDIRHAIVDERMDQLALKADPPNAALINTWAKANHEGYRQADRLEVTGEDGGPVRVEHKGVDAATLFAILHPAGAFDEVIDGEATEDDPAGRALPSAREVLSARPER